MLQGIEYRLASKSKVQIKDGVPLSGRDLDLLNLRLASYMDFHTEFYEVAEAHECWLEEADEIFTAVSVTPFERFQAVMLALSAALVLYDNYLLAISIFENDKKLRRFLNHRDSAYNINASE